MERSHELPLNEAEINISEHVPSKLQADTLFHFTDDIKWLFEALKNKLLSARYHCEDLQAFAIPGLELMAYPMKCFCDINIHRLKDHIRWYGAYGIAFSKEWGMNKGIQPVQYINSESPLCKDLSAAFGRLLMEENSEQGPLKEMLENLSLLQLLYWKPYQGTQRNKETNNMEQKCFCDESEWRFIPDVSVLNMPMIIRDENILKGGLLIKYSDSLNGQNASSIEFCYDDIKHIILEKASDYILFEENINSWGLDNKDRLKLCSKVLIWDDIKEDV